MRRWIRFLAAALAVSLPACGDGVFIVRVNTGVIVGDPRCQGSGGQFDLRDQSGLLVVVVITGNTHIVVPGGLPGTCSDLSADTPVEVAGQRNGDRIVASSVTAGG